MRLTLRALPSSSSSNANDAAARLGRFLFDLDAPACSPEGAAAPEGDEKLELPGVGVLRRCERDMAEVRGCQRVQRVANRLLSCSVEWSGV